MANVKRTNTNDAIVATAEKIDGVTIVSVRQVMDHLQSHGFPLEDYNDADKAKNRSLALAKIVDRQTSLGKAIRLIDQPTGTRKPAAEYDDDLFDSLG